MTEVEPILQLSDIDLLIGELRDPSSVRRLKKMGFEIGPLEPLERARVKVLGTVDRRWLNLYERAMKRYPRALVVVRDRVCQGCFITLPTSASPGADAALTLCESCGRILYWR
jgi:hypothetical protein